MHQLKIIIEGVAASGKSTLCDYLTDLLVRQGHTLNISDEGHETYQYDVGVPIYGPLKEKVNFSIETRVPKAVDHD